MRIWPFSRGILYNFSCPPPPLKSKLTNMVVFRDNLALISNYRVHLDLFSKFDDHQTKFDLRCRQMVARPPPPPNLVGTFQGQGEGKHHWGGRRSQFFAYANLV